MSERWQFDDEDDSRECSVSTGQGRVERSVSMTTRTLRTNVGSAAFLSPEQCSQHMQQPRPQHERETPRGEAGADWAEWSGQQMDVWATGVTLYYCLFRVLPFQSSSPHRLYQLIVQQQLSFPPIPVPVEHSDHRDWLLAVDLITRLLHKEPTQRMTLAEAKVHPFVTRDGREPLLEDDDDDPTAPANLAGDDWSDRALPRSPMVSPRVGAGRVSRVFITPGELNTALTAITHKSASRRLAAHSRGQSPRHALGGVEGSEGHRRSDSRAATSALHAELMAMKRASVAESADEPPQSERHRTSSL